MKILLRSVVFFFVALVAVLPMLAGLAFGLVWAGFWKGANVARELCRACWEWCFGPRDHSRWGPGALVLLVPSCLLGLGGCGEDREESFLAEAPRVVHESNGFKFGVYGPRETGYAPDLFPSIELGLVTVEEIGLALEAEARELAARTGLDAQAAVDELRALKILIVDDYSFQVYGLWASGLYQGRIVVALWSRIKVADQADVPPDAPGWTVRAPSRGESSWRYGARPLVPAMDHELGHHYFGPRFEH